MILKERSSYEINAIYIYRNCLLYLSVLHQCALQVETYLSDLKKDMSKALSVQDVDGGAAMFKIASKKAGDLSILPLRLFDGDDLTKLFSKILGILVLHGSIALKLPVEAVSTTQLTRIAYVIGTKVSIHFCDIICRRF